MAAARPGITVVVPLYGDPESLRRCLRSLVAHVDPSTDRVLLVNDSGPEADAIEAVVREQTAGETIVEYVRNPANLGFVGTCNRAALELDRSDRDVLLLNSDTETTPGFLDELSAVLHAAPDHGIVCARSNNATIASLPHRLRDPSSPRTPERTRAVHETLVAELPRFSESPVAMGFCFLVRRELIARYGLFDEAFAPGYGEENDFCLRMAAAGYRSLIAHRALVFHIGSRSFSRTRRAKLRAAHERLLVERHPFYPAAVQQYLTRVADPVDVFADALVPVDDRPRILIDPGDGIGTPRPDVDVLLQAARDAADAGEAVVTIRDDDAPAEGLYDLGITWRSHTDLEQAMRMSRDCLRWAVVGRDVAPFWAERVRDAARVAVDDDARLFADDLELGADAGSTREHLLAAARRPVDLNRLRARWSHYARLAAHREPTPSRPHGHWLDRHAPVLAGVARGIRRRMRRR